MTPAARNLRRDFARVLLLPALSLLLIPLLGWGVAGLAARSYDGRFLEAASSNINAATDIPDAQKPEVKAFYAANPPSVVCRSSDPELANYREGVCKPGEDMWQFMWAERVSKGALGVGVLGLLGALLLALLVWRSPRSQYAGFMAGWVGLTAVSAVEVVAQAALAVWMSYWVTALLFHIYVPKLILIVAVAAAMGVWTALRGLFRRVRFTPTVEGEVITEKDSPALWRRLAELASRIGTPAPTTVIAGIDDNFFVTEAPMQVGQTQVAGRALFVSLPLLRVMSAPEADAVLAHELAHFRGGDTAHSARLGPALTRYDTYLHELGDGLMTMPAFYVLRMFRVVFEFARQKEQRERELVADRTAAQTVSAEHLARALMKVTAYSSYRAATEQELFAQNEKHEGALALSARVAAGLGTHVATAQFQQTWTAGNVPHPFDSHPPLQERLKKLGSSLDQSDCAHLLGRAPEATWADQLPTAGDIEGRLWAAYEARFVSAHEENLAYRYWPEGDEQRALVEKFFPPQAFTFKDGSTCRVSWQGFDAQDGAHLPWGEVLSATLDEGDFKSELNLNHVLEAPSGKGPTSINLRKLGNAAQQGAFKEAVGRFWGRHQASRQWAAQQAAGAAGDGAAGDGATDGS